MKILSFIMLILFVFTGYAQVEKLTKEEWREDLVYLRDKVTHEYSHLFYRITGKEFEDDVAQLWAEIPDLKHHEIMVRMASLIANFKIGHTGISLTESHHGAVLRTGFHQLPLNFYLFKDGLFVQGASQKFAHLAGAKVLRLGKYDIETAIAMIRPVVSIENEQFFKAYGVNMLRSPEVLHALGITASISSVPMKIEKEGEVSDVELVLEDVADHIPAVYGLVRNEEGWVNFRETEATPVWLKHLDEKYRFEYLEEEQTLYVRQSAISDDPEEPIHRFYQRVFEFVDNNQVEKFILDLRLNSGGQGHLNLPIVLGLIKSRLNERGKLFVIIGRNTFSAAQNLVNKLETYTEAIFVGEPTSSNVNSWGDTRIETLPNSQLEVRLSYLWHQEHPTDRRKWTSPDLPVEMSSEDYSSNNDVVLHAILNFEQSFLYATIEIQRFYEKGEFTKAQNLMKTLKTRFHGNESKIRRELNTMGYSLMQKDRLDAALQVFTFNTEILPDEPNTWDSLAECYLRKNDLQNAIKYYEKVIKMDPNGHTGNNARMMLNHINSPKDH